MDMKQSLIWMRDKFAVWLASVTVFSFLWLAVGVAVGVLFVWDGVWSREQAPSNLDPLTFQAAGWVMRLWTVFALAGAVWCFRHRALVVGCILIFTWMLTSIMSYGHALGFIATGQSERYQIAAAVVNVETAVVSSGVDQITALEAQKETIRQDRDTELERLDRRIREVQNNGIGSDDYLAEIYAAEGASVSTEARARLSAIDAQIMEVHASKQAARTTGASDAVTAVKFDPLYVLLAEWTDGEDGPPNDATVRAIAQRGGAFWALLIEMIGGAGPAILYSIHAHMAARKEPEPDDEMSEREKAWQEYQNRRAGDRKATRTRRRGNKIEAGDTYYRDKISEFMVSHNEGLSTAEIAKKHGISVAVLRTTYWPHMTEEERAALFAPSAEPDSPKEYPVDFPTNDKPDGGENGISNE